ncbi:MAG: DinB family protein [Acidobacteriia bacterium]|nr:DinB family protein [Terriglobia bacterium]
MPSHNQPPFRALLPILILAALPVFGQTDVQTVVLKHLKTSRDFTLQVANQMPESSYDFKLTPPQMSFAEQMVHLSQEMGGVLANFSGGKPVISKPASLKKTDVLAFIQKSFDGTIDQVSKLTPDQIAKTYQSEAGTVTGLEVLMFLMDHTTHHRASAEMYLRAKGITPAEYQF